MQTRNFVEISPKEAGLPWWRRLLRADLMIKKEISTTVKNVGVRTFYELNEIPSVFTKITLPVVIHKKDHSLPLIVTKVTHPPYRNPSRPYLIYTAFDPGFPQERLEICSEKDVYGNVEPVYAWWFWHGGRFAELWKDALDGRLAGFTTWSKEKIVPIETA
jgi:hypothetical protein